MNHHTGHCNSHLENHFPDGVVPDYLTMVLQKVTPSGKELFNTYGDLPNSELLRCYGFVDAVNPYDVVSIPFDCLVDDTGRSKELLSRKNWLKSAIDSGDFKLEFGWHDGVARASDDLINAACSLCMGDMQFSLLKKTFKKHGFRAVPSALRASRFHEYVLHVTLLVK